MKLTVLQENLISGLLRVGHCVSTKPQLPVLGNVLFKTDKGRLKLSTTNLEIGINVWVGAKIEKEGAITIPARVLTEFVSSLSAGKIEVEVEGMTFKILSGPSEAKINGVSADEFPVVITEGVKKLADFEEALLVKIIDKVCFAAATDEGRPVLTGVLMVFNEKGIRAAATDGYRLSVVDAEIGAGIKRELILPAKMLMEVSRAIKGEGETEGGRVGMFLTEKDNQVVFRKDEVEVVSRLIEGRFPEFEKIVPDEKKTRVWWDREEFLRAVKTASIFARDSANIVRIKVDKKECLISANAEQVGENRCRVVGRVEGKEDEIAFNYKYLMDFLNTFDEEEVMFEMNGPLSPGVFKSKKKGYLHIIMPVRVQG
jgi:DNA polymerase-3 subunit beta